MPRSKIHIAKYEPGRLGGGWSFARQFSEALKNQHTDYAEADVYFIPSPSMVERSEVEQAKRDGKYIALRVDNIIRNSRNRNTGMSRMRDMSEIADVVIYQSTFARDILKGWVKPRSEAIILNGCNRNVFHDNDRHESPYNRYLYSRYNRDETKNWEMARFIYEQAASTDPDSVLTIIGQFSQELRDYNFDFYRGEKWQYLGVVANPASLGEIYRNTDYLIYTYFNDACSNTLIEALCCGCEIVDPYSMQDTGGSGEIMYYFEQRGANYFSAERMAREYLELLS